ncbi:metallophosphoesterase, partial [Candidatus Poribacteria bacterium]|nr:metallophosphoesterase [Candidatus Poribacteria bacterium]
MSEMLTWLHLSDLHACKPLTGWDAKRVTDTLRTDLERMQNQHGLRPDLIFFTGDAAFGQIGNKRGEAIVDQFREAHDFLTAVREVFNPAIDQRNVFLVPGNHDVNRDRITRFETVWLEQEHSLDEITRLLQEAKTDWRQLLGRLDDYAHFLASYGYDHLLTERERLIYADAREVAGLRVGIAGFNSAWSSRGAGREEMGRLWMAGRFQLETLLQQLPPNDFAIALVHHPSNWLVPEENPEFGRQLERDFPFVLHGHEHQDFVRHDASTGHTVISAGACHEWSEGKNNGYNFVRLNLATGVGEVWLREYESIGGGWRPRVITGRTDDLGCWRLEHLDPWMGKLSRARAGEGTKAPGSPSDEADMDEDTADVLIDRAADYEARYRKAV